MTSLLLKQVREAETLRFIKQALGGMPSAIVPFNRDPLDIYATALNRTNRRDLDIVLFDATTQVEAGYFRLSAKGVSYVDTAQPLTEVVEYFNPDKIATALAALTSIDTSPPQLTMFEDDQSHLQIHSDIASQIEPLDGESEVTLYIFDFEKLRAGTSRLETCQLGRFRLQRRQQGFAIKVEKSEKLLELHAGSIQGYWLLMEVSTFKFLCPLPNFAEDLQTKFGWLYPTSLLKELTPGSDKFVDIEFQAAIDLFGAHRWAEFGRVEQWLEIINATNQELK